MRQGFVGIVGKNNIYERVCARRISGGDGCIEFLKLRIKYIEISIYADNADKEYFG